MDGNECKTKENIHNNKRKLKITWEKITYNTYTLDCKTVGFFSVFFSLSFFSSINLKEQSTESVDPRAHARITSLCGTLTVHSLSIYIYIHRGAGMAQWLSICLPRRPPTNVSPDSASYVCWVCCWFSSLLREVFLRVLRFPPLLKHQHFQIPIRSGIRGPQICQSDRTVTCHPRRLASWGKTRQLPRLEFGLTSKKVLPETSPNYLQYKIHFIVIIRVITFEYFKMQMVFNLAPISLSKKKWTSTIAQDWLFWRKMPRKMLTRAFLSL